MNPMYEEREYYYLPTVDQVCMKIRRIKICMMLMENLG